MPVTSKDARPRCKGPQCTRAAIRNGLCHAHSAQAARGTPLHPLRPQRPALASVTIRVPESVRAAVLADVEGAREVLEAWAKPRRVACCRRCGKRPGQPSNDGICDACMSA